MGAYGTPEHPPNQNDNVPKDFYGNYGQYQYPYHPVKKLHKRIWIIITVIIIGILVAMERYGAYLNSQGYEPDTNTFAVVSSSLSEENSSAPSSTTTPASFISKETYDKLTTGMTYEAVVKLFGLPGKQIYESGEKGSGDFVVSYLWENENGPQQIQIDFLENKLWRKTEYYLE